MRAHALILAAGQGRRFGGGKLHALYRGHPLLSYVLHVVEVARKRGLLDGGHVVVAADDERALTLARARGLGTVINGAPELGLSHSVRLGLAALEARTIEESGAALVFLGDQPLVRTEVVGALVAAWKHGSGPIIRPRYQARPDAPGHPVLLARSIWARARQLEGDRGFSALLDSSPPETVTLDVTGDNPDVDTRADLKALEGIFPMKLEFSGSPEIAAPRERVWQRLMDPHFVAKSAPGVESVEIIDPAHFKVISGFGVGSIKVRFTMDVELFDIVPGQRAKMRVHGKAPGSALDVLSSLEIQDAGPDKVRLSWSATSEISGTIAGVGARLMEGTARKLTEQFWADFARRVNQE